MKRSAFGGMGTLTNSFSKKPKQSPLQLARTVLCGTSNLPTTIEQAIDFISQSVIWLKFQGQFPPIILQSQLYCLMDDRSQVNAAVEELRKKNELVLVYLEVNEYGLIRYEDYKKFVCSREMDAETLTIVDKMFNTCQSTSLDISFDVHFLRKTCDISDDNVTKLMRVGMLHTKDVDSWWLGVPNASKFLKQLKEGRAALIGSINRQKFKEVSLRELLNRNIGKVKKLGCLYFVLDIIGREDVMCLETTTGVILRVKQ